MSTRWMRYFSSRSRSAGKTRLTSQSRSACMSRKVDEMNTRTVFQVAAIRQVRREHAGGSTDRHYPAFARALQATTRGLVRLRYGGRQPAVVITCRIAVSGGRPVGGERVADRLSRAA